MGKARRSKLANAVKGAVTENSRVTPGVIPPGVVLAQKSEHFEGPIPHPELLERYNSIVPGAAERILQMAEKEQAHRHKIDAQEESNRTALIKIAEKDSAASNTARKSGQFIGLVVTLICVIAAVYFASKGSSWEIILGFLAIPTASFIRAFIDIRSSGKNNKES